METEATRRYHQTCNGMAKRLTICNAAQDTDQKRDVKPNVVCVQLQTQRCDVMRLPYCFYTICSSVWVIFGGVSATETAKVERHRQQEQEVPYLFRREQRNVLLLNSKHAVRLFDVDTNQNHIHVFSLQHLLKQGKNHASTGFASYSLQSTYHECRSLSRIQSLQQPYNLRVHLAFLSFPAFFSQNNQMLLMDGIKTVICVQRKGHIKHSKHLSILDKAPRSTLPVCITSNPLLIYIYSHKLVFHALHHTPPVWRTPH